MRESTIIYLVGLSRPGESSVFASQRANDRANDRGARRKKFQRAFASRAFVRAASSVSSASRRVARHPSPQGFAQANATLPPRLEGEEDF